MISMDCIVGYVLVHALNQVLVRHMLKYMQEHEPEHMLGRHMLKYMPKYNA